MRFIPWSGSAASAPQDRLRKCSLASVETASHRHAPRATEGQHPDRQWPESLGQKHHAPGVDRKSLTEVSYGVVRRLQLPPIFDGKFNCLVWIFAKRHNFLSKNFYVPPRAARITTRPIWITLVLKFQVKAKPMHPLENFVGRSILFDGKVAASANERFLGHGGFHDV